MGQRVLASHGHVCGRPLQTPHAAQRQWPLLCEGAPLSREAVAQQDVRAGGPAPGAASLSAWQEAAEVEAPVYLAPAGRPGLALSNSGAGLRRARRRRRHAPPGPDAGLRGSTPAFQSRRRESEARQRPPAAGPRVELARICFPCTSPACQPLDSSRSHRRT